MDFGISPASSASTYDVEFMNCHMPALDGDEATRELRRAALTTWATPPLATEDDGMVSVAY